MAEIDYHKGFHGTYQIGDQTLIIGKKDIMPYDMTYGAIASCLFATFLGIAKKKDIYVRDAHVSIDGKKRKKTPTTLEYISIRVTVDTDADEEAVKECMGQALLECSMVQTFALIADIDCKTTVGKYVRPEENEDEEEAPSCNIDGSGC